VGALSLPGAPDAWTGSVVLVPDDQVERLDIPLPEFLGVFEKLGRECASLPIAGNRQETAALNEA
jgi:hypothetical protein